MQQWLAMALLWTFSSTFAQEPDSKAGAACVKPPPGIFKNACEAQTVETLYQSKHDGDKWIDCEEMGGQHGTAGSGVAVFFESEARPYWQEEIRWQLDSLRQLLPRRQFLRVQREQYRWEGSLPELISKAQRGVSGEGGTLSMYIGEGQAMLVVRKRALILACAIEQLQSKAGSKEKP